jgi:hypothetical protein
LSINEADNRFNEKQRIILVASDFDEQTLSAVAWLNSNNVDMSCFKLSPYKIKEDIYWDVEKLLPITDYSDYYVNLMDKPAIGESKGKKGITKRYLPRIDALLEWGAVKAGDTIVAKGREDEGTLLKNGNIDVEGVEQSMAVWLKNIYGWSAVQTFKFAIQKESGKSLLQIREEYMNKREAESEEI